MNKFDSIVSKNIDEFARWLYKYGMHDGSPWIKWWDNNYCRNCELLTVMCYDPEIKCNWCQYYGKCKFFQDKDDIPDCEEIIKMWLESEENE